jgi:hypothetical protein
MLKVKTQYEKIGKDKCFTFYIEDVETNTLIYSSSFLVCKENKRDFNKLKHDFVSYVQDLQKMELEMVKAQSFKLTENKKVIEIN